MYQKYSLEKNEVCKRVLKYLIVALAVAFASNNIPEKAINIRDIAMIAMTASCVFAIVDMYSPSTEIQVNK